MSSPIAHTAVGYLFWRKARGEFPLARHAAAFILLSLIPDFDALPGILSGDLYRYHNNLSHSLFAGAAAALFIGLAAGAARAGKVRTWAGYGLLCYWTHVLMDYLTVGRGVMLFWPLSSERHVSPLTVFYGLHWSEGLWSSHHIYTVLTESLFVGALFLLLRLSGRTPVID
jgi:membrane-bound metal-dependent hydrolase YbcI (DUF457 family)